jgi:hypothetical protein
LSSLRFTMAKAPEEGEIWEWRAFGRVDERLASRVIARPTRLGIADHPGTDLYLISEASDQNVKLRKWRSEWLLKFKLLISKAPREVELYRESSTTVYNFPVSYDELQFAASLLDVHLKTPLDKNSFTDSDFINALISSSPPAIKVEVSKLRSQYDFGDGWVELAHVSFPARRTQTLSIHSAERETVEKILEFLQPGREMEAMNYVEACRRWGQK